MSVSLLLPGHTYASDVMQRTIYVNDTPIQASVMSQNNYQLVPAVWFRSLSANVTWSQQYRSAVLSSNQTMIGFPARQSFADYDLMGLNQWKRDHLATTSVMYDGSLYVPVAYTARKLGMQVTYDPHTKRTSIQNASTTQLTAKATDDAQQLASADDQYWLNQITEAEASGESYSGKLAVAATILNRVKSPDWPSSIKEVIFQVTTFDGVSYYQFSPVLDKRIYDVTPSEDTKKAVQAALNGEDPSQGAVVFYNPEKTDNEWVRSREVTVKIGGHIFAR